MTWTQRGELIYPVGLSEDAKSAIAQAYVDHAGLETLDSELQMFDKAAPASNDWGATETHRRIATALFPALADAIQTAIPTPDDGLWYVLNIESELVATNDPARLDGDTITFGLEWEIDGASYGLGNVVRYRGKLAECILAHATHGDPNWAPDVAVSLWKRYLTPGKALPWRQPQGAHDVYPEGARVTHGDQVYVSTIADNGWEPGVAGWELEAEPGEDWVDSGETIMALVSANAIRVTDTAPFAAGQSIRIAGEHEATVSYIHTAGAPGILVIDPHVNVGGGEAIEIWL